MPRRQLVPGEGGGREEEWGKSNPRLEVEFDFWLSSPMAQCNLVASAQHLQSLRWLRLPAVHGLANELLGDLSRRGRESKRGRELQQLHFALWLPLCFCHIVRMFCCAVSARCKKLCSYRHMTASSENMNKGPTGHTHTHIHMHVYMCVCVQRCSCRAYHNVAGCALSYQPSHSSRGAARAPVQFNQHYFCLNQLQLITFLLSWQRQRQRRGPCASLECRQSVASFEPARLAARPPACLSFCLWARVLFPL